MKVLAATLVTLLLLATCSPSEGHLDEGLLEGSCQGMWHQMANPWREPRLCRSWGLTRAVCLSPALTDGVPTSCCFSYHRQPIPQSRVRSVVETSSSCRQPGVIVTNKKNRTVCADPQAAWVKQLLKHFQSQGN
ncbi:C-C motif chemokine 3-like [Sylvia atricapilla]|uniref:C-C motif chemokine 3-like n=1 Tax=Sylvia atricapilla TaxID=48155 RepID=UPI0033976DBE